ncbi:hypothetical protein C8D94_101449 [Marinirhabdus gelatinilytica]|uniref:Uncharacterized protein n=1 Tax=Marinirhabdus gelatinilytica TaxID=1703343 RepID=A0A370QJP0_9FLAO|nr:hypothetical protein C8D94_101449 [Marinirhabdus gelatinilytica]
MNLIVDSGVIRLRLPNGRGKNYINKKTFLAKYTMLFNNWNVLFKLFTIENISRLWFIIFGIANMR